MYKHLLVAVDDSPSATQTLAEAVTLARAHGARVSVVHAIDESLFPNFSSSGTTLIDKGLVQSALIAEGQTVLDKALRQVRDAGLDCTGQLLSSETQHAAAQIVAAAENLAADLIVVGSHGRRGVQRLIVGSVAEKVLRKSHVSVLVVRIAP